MHDVDKPAVIKAWIRHCQEPEAYDECSWALEIIDGAVKNHPDQGWTWIKGLVNNCPNDQVLANIAAGPLENLMNKKSQDFIDRIEVFANESHAFRKCLTGVWNISPWEVNQRVAKLTESVTDPL